MNYHQGTLNWREVAMAPISSTETTNAHNLPKLLSKNVTVGATEGGVLHIYIYIYILFLLFEMG